MCAGLPDATQHAHSTHNHPTPNYNMDQPNPPIEETCYQCVQPYRMPHRAHAHITHNHPDCNYNTDQPPPATTHASHKRMPHTDSLIVITVFRL